MEILTVIFSHKAHWILVFLSLLLLAPPLDKGVIVGDFAREEYSTKLSPLNDATIVVQDVYFPSHGETCHAWLYTKPPSSSSSSSSSIDTEDSATESATVEPSPAPVVVMAHGFGGQKDFGLDRYAERFVEAGFAVFMFDYRNFGASSGTPRNWVSPQRHLEDYHACLDFIESQPSELAGKVDSSKIALWGTSFSGGHVLEIASQRSRDANIVGVVSQVPHLSGKVASKKGIQKRGLYKMVRLLWASLQDKCRQIVGLKAIMVKIIGTGSDLAMMDVTSEDLARYLEKHPLQKLGGWVNQTPARILLEIRFYNPIETLRRAAQQQDSSLKIQVPVLLIGATLDDLCPTELIEEASTLIPRSKLIIREGTHFQIYEPQNSIFVADEMVKFYSACLNTT